MSIFGLLARLGASPTEKLIFVLKETASRIAAIGRSELSKSHWDAHFKAGAALVEIGGPAVEPLIRLLDDDDMRVASTACVCLGRIGDPRALGPIITFARSDRCSGYERRDVLDAIREIGGSAVPMLVPYLGEERFGIGELAAELIETSVTAAVEQLVAALDERPELRSHVIPLLGQCRDPRVVVPLISVLDAELPDVRYIACNALAEIADERAVPRLIEALKDRVELVRGAAAKALGKLGDERAVDPLIQTLKVGKDGVRRETAYALGLLGNRRAVEPLIATLGELDVKYDSDKDTAIAVANALGALGDARAVEPLGRYLAGPTKVSEVTQAIGML